MANNNNIGPRRLVVGAHYGIGDWLIQRITGLVLAIYTVILLVTYGLVVTSIQAFAGVKTTGNGLGNTAKAGGQHIPASRICSPPPPRAPRLGSDQRRSSARRAGVEDTASRRTRQAPISAGRLDDQEPNKGIPSP